MGKNHKGLGNHLLNEFPMLKWSIRLILLLVFAVPLSTGLRGEEVLVDQQSDYLRLWHTFGFGFKFGQEFVPELGTLNFVDLWFHQVHPSQPGVFQVNIRDASLAGELLGSSEIVTIQLGSPEDVTHFVFETPVTFTPGNTYVIELLWGGGDYWGWTLGGGTSDDGISTPYPSGRMIRDVPLELFDLKFREGVVVPEPSTGILLGLSGIILVGKFLLMGRKRLL